MTSLRSAFSVAAALLALLGALGASGCGDRSADTLPAEIDDPYYVQGKQLMKQGRMAEALNAFLKVIDRRGERGAPESNLEAANIYLTHIQDPVEAYHHFRRYLVLKPNSKEAVEVRGMLKAAQRDFAKTLPARPLEDQSARLEIQETVDRLQRENAELRAQIATLRGSGSGTAGRVAPMITLPDEAAPAPRPARGEDPRLTTLPAPAPSALVAPPAAPAPAPKATPPARPTPAAGARSHTVQPKETIFGISMQYYGHGRGTGAIYQANRDSMRHPTDLRPGMVLRIPPAER